MFYLLEGRILWRVNDHALRELRDVPPRTRLWGRVGLLFASFARFTIIFLAVAKVVADVFCHGEVFVRPLPAAFGATSHVVVRVEVGHE